MRRRSRAFALLIVGEFVGGLLLLLLGILSGSNALRDVGLAMALLLVPISLLEVRFFGRRDDRQ
jgi:hypothetical protein